MTFQTASKELVARVQALLRRVKPKAPKSATLRVDDIFLEYQTHLVAVDEKPVELTRSEFDLLAILMASPGRVFARSELLQELQGAVIEGYERTVDVHIKNLRAKIEPEPSDPHYIETVYGVGYRFSRQAKGK